MPLDEEELEELVVPELVVEVEDELLLDDGATQTW
jgi:hypothetical protein